MKIKTKNFLKKRLFLNKQIACLVLSACATTKKKQAKMQGDV